MSGSTEVVFWVVFRKEYLKRSESILGNQSHPAIALIDSVVIEMILRYTQASSPPGRAEFLGSEMLPLREPASREGEDGAGSNNARGASRIEG